MNKHLTDSLEKLGYRSKIISSAHSIDARNVIIKLSERKDITDSFYKIRLANLEYEFSDKLFEAKSIIIIAVPTPISEVLFNWKDKPISLKLPPTYVYYREIFRKIEKIVKEILGSKNYKAIHRNLPLKILATYSGLAKYGKNNITYVPGMGSFYQLVGLYSDLPPENDTWQEPQMMERCINCTACIKKCPTNAIRSDRFLINAELCLSFFNESTNEFPAWLKPEWHNSLCGCLVCQEICPENKNFGKTIERVCEFSNEETELLLKGVQFNELRLETQDKLSKTELDDYYNVLQRNLLLFIK